MMEDAQVKRLEELAIRAARSGAVQYTRFLDPALLMSARAAAAKAGARVAFWGGYDDAERCVAAFFAEEAPANDAYPLAVMRLSWNAKFASPAHRDLLGAAMGLGIERDTTGDIAMGRHRGADCAYLFALPEVADYIAANLTSAGRASLRVSRAEGEIDILPPQGQSLRVTVQQPRLDALLAAACHLSRSEAQRLIAAGLVKLNHVVTLRADAKLEAGDLISARGHGRIRVDAFQGESRRGREVVSLFLYGQR